MLHLCLTFFQITLIVIFVLLSQFEVLLELQDLRVELADNITLLLTLHIVDCWLEVVHKFNDLILLHSTACDQGFLLSPLFHLTLLFELFWCQSRTAEALAIEAHFQLLLLLLDFLTELLFTAHETNVASLNVIFNFLEPFVDDRTAILDVLCPALPIRALNIIILFNVTTFTYTCHIDALLTLMRKWTILLFDLITSFE